MHLTVTLKVQVLRQEHKWECASCGHGYDLAAVEAQLLAVVRRRARAYQTQDLRCLKCKQASLCAFDHSQKRGA